MASSLKRFRETCLDRAKRALSLSEEGEADSDGVLSGADQISVENLRDAKELLWPTSLTYDPFSAWATCSRTYQPGTNRAPPASCLPPGVMAATPPSGYLFEQQKNEETFSGRLSATVILVQNFLCALAPSGYLSQINNLKLICENVCYFKGSSCCSDQ